MSKPKMPAFDKPYVGVEPEWNLWMHTYMAVLQERIKNNFDPVTAVREAWVAAGEVVDLWRGNLKSVS